MIQVSVCVPTHFRSNQLKDCLSELSTQLAKNDELIIGLSKLDHEAIKVIEGLKANFNCPVIIDFTNFPSVILKLNSMVTKASKPWIVTIDDDAIPRHNWLICLRSRMENESVGAIGGRDVQIDKEQFAAHVGIVNFFGRVYGNHEKVSDGLKEVHFLKGVNFAIRREFFPISPKMIYQGPEPHWEIALCRTVSKHNLRVVYDPKIEVDHLPGKRIELDRETNSKLAYIYNRNLVLAFGLAHDYFNMVKILCYQIIVGRSPAYGFMKILSLQNKRKSGFTIWKKSMKGLFDALKIVFFSMFQK